MLSESLEAVEAAITTFDDEFSWRTWCCQTGRPWARGSVHRSRRPTTKERCRRCSRSGRRSDPDLRPQVRLAAALAAAKHAALAGREGGDGGSCNLDSAFLDAKPGLRGESVARAAKAADVSLGIRWRTKWWNGWMVHVHQGQGAMRTRMAEAAAKALNDAGESASVYYRVD